MGLFFSNIHIRKNDRFDLSQLENMLIQSMNDQGYQIVDTEDDSEVSVRICCGETSEWASVASDCFDFQTPKDTRSAAEPFSTLFQTDVLVANCVDSDFMILNLINEEDGTDAWINVGMPYDFRPPRQTGFRNTKNNVVGIGLDAWKNKVTDYEKFQAIMQKEYTFAEDALCQAGDFMGMSAAQCILTTDCYNDPDDMGNVTTLFFALPQKGRNELPVLEVSQPSLTPCAIGQDSCVFVVNKGGRSKGIAVIFEGDYIAQDELTFDQVTLEYELYQNPRKIIPIQLEKRKAADGRCFWYWQDEDFQIPPKVNQDLPLMKREDMEHKRNFGVRFVPHGNPRKVLDIMVFITPLENYNEGAACWYVWGRYPDKRTYIEEMNRSFGEIWKKFDPSMILNPDDYDL